MTPDDHADEYFAAKPIQRRKLWAKCDWCNRTRGVRFLKENHATGQWFCADWTECYRVAFAKEGR
jgi:hypothetical protein